MSTPAQKSFLSVNPRNLLPALFLLTFLSVALLAHGVGSALSFAAAGILLALPVARKACGDLPPKRWDRVAMALAPGARHAAVVTRAGKSAGKNADNNADNNAEEQASNVAALLARDSLQ